MRFEEKILDKYNKVFLKGFQIETEKDAADPETAEPIGTDRNRLELIGTDQN